MEIIYGDLFTGVSERQFRISKDEVNSTVRGPDEIKRIPMDYPNELLFFLKKFPSGHYLLVECNLIGTKGIIGLCYRLDKKFVEETNSKEPLVILEKVANRFGTIINIGSTNSRFVVGESFLLPSGLQPQQMIGGETPQGHQIIPNTLIRVRTEGTEIYVDVALGYCLDATEYHNYLVDTF